MRGYRKLIVAVLIIAGATWGMLAGVIPSAEFKELVAMTLALFAVSNGAEKHG